MSSSPKERISFVYCRVLKEGGADIQIKIKKLVSAGVLGFQR